jgi:AcrR family transcriptional regulator
MSASEQPTGRYRQRRRTRAAIVEAATELLRAGTTPSVNDVAEAADVSRRTVYLYFPKIEQLLADATVGLLSQAAIDEAIEAADTGADPAERVAAMIRAVYAAADDTLPLGRQLIRLTVDAPDTADTAGEGGDRAPRRGYRRIGWIERALEPLRPQLDDANYERLVSGLAMVVGWEALIVLHDVRGLSAAEQLDTTLWAARTLVRAALDDSRVNAS